MKVLRRLLAITIIISVLITLANSAFGLTQTLTSRIIAVVKAKPEINIADEDKAIEEINSVSEMATDTSMVNPYIRVQEKAGIYGNTVYTITDKL